MYEITYRIIITDKLKRAYVSADSARDAREILTNQYLVGAIAIISTVQVSMSTVVYIDGRF
jgi:hypothetical protein